MQPNSTLEKILQTIKKLIPRGFFRRLQPAYHYTLSLLGAIMYRFPSKSLNIVFITGTKGKTSTTELVNALLEEAGYATAIAGTLRFKIGKEEERNMFKMTIPGRFFLQKFLRRAVNAKCDWVIIEMTSEGAKLYRHKFIQPNALIFTNLSPEHIESHGSFENYKEAKLSLARAISNSPKRPRTLVVNADDQHGSDFLAVEADTKTSYSIKDAEPYSLEKDATTLTYAGQTIHTHLSGIFNVYNILAAVSFARTLGITPEVAKRALEKFHGIRGRVEKVNAGQDFDVIVDYAHTADSLEKVYEVFQDSRKICVLGGTGGGRDTSKRPIMGSIAGAHCDEIILTNEDPYDEDPQKIIDDIKAGIADGNVEVVMDRREAIARAIRKAQTGDAVLITGKGTDPYIMEANGVKTPWDDARVAREELEKFLHSK